MAWITEVAPVTYFAGSMANSCESSNANSAATFVIPVRGAVLSLPTKLVGWNAVVTALAAAAAPPPPPPAAAV